jgi:amino acid transporter
VAQGTRRRLSTAWVFFLVVSAAAPLASIVGTAPLSLAQGNGAGLPGAYVIATVILLCFAAGYAAISRRVINTGAFYTYIARGIGRPPAIGAAMLAVAAYGVNVAGVTGVIGYFVKIIAGELGFTISWVWGSAFALIGVALLGYRSVTLSAKVLGTVLVLETVVLLGFDGVVLWTKGFAALPAASFSPHTMLSGSPGLAVMFALTCFVGLESAALYSEETDQPERSVPRVIYIAVAGMGGFYVLSSWILVGSIGADRTHDVATEKLGNLVFDQATAFGGEALQTALALLFLSSAFASVLAFHNAASRYLFVLGRDRLLPSRLGEMHPRHRSPSFASLTVTIGTAIIVGIAAIARLDPYVVLGQAAVGLATLGIVALQLLAAIAIVVFFRRRGQGQYWTTLVLPGLGAVGLAWATGFLLLNWRTLVGGSGPILTLVPWLLVAVTGAGVLLGLRIRKRRPARYARLAESRLRPEARRLPRPARWTRRYCLVGAGPAGLAMARRLNEEGIPFDWFERYGDVGGIWHAERPESPVHDRMTTVSSKYTLAFPDFPMPPRYPDFPSWQQVRDYLRGYAQAFSLYDQVRFNTAVTWAKPDGVGWSVTLTTGEFRYYSGIIAAAGSGWQPVAPSWPGQESFRGEIWHSARYESASQLRGRRVLVIGAGDSGAEIASDAAQWADAAFLSVRRGHLFVPEYVGDVPTDAVLAGVLEPPESLSLPPDPTELVATLLGDVSALGLPAPDAARPVAHPTINTNLLRLLGDGRLLARPAVLEIHPDGVRFADGRYEQVDLIVLATGYDRRPPFLAPELYCGPDGQPDMYLNMFSRGHDGLTVLGLSELGGASFPRFDEMARAAIVDITLRELGGLEWRIWHGNKQHDVQDLRGGRGFANPYKLLVDDHAYQAALAEVGDRFGYAPRQRSSASRHVKAPVSL